MQLIEKFFKNYGPTTPVFKKLAKEYQLEVLDSKINNEEIERVIKITLDGLAVLGAISTTKLADKTFADILQNAGEIPIGERLFCLNSNIVRDKMVISLTKVHAISNPFMRDFIETFAKDQENVYVRFSEFVCNRREHLYLTEFATPLLEKFLADHNF